MDRRYITAKTSPVAALVEQYAARFHEGLNGTLEKNNNFITSPLGAWLLIALISGANKNGYTVEQHAKLESILGTNITEAYRLATELLTAENIEVGATVGVWVKDMIAVDNNAWLNTFEGEARKNKSAVEYQNYMPSKEELDEWTNEKTLGIIPVFPVDVNERVKLLIASVIATKIKWNVPFNVAPNTLNYFGTEEILHAPATHVQRLLHGSNGEILGMHAATSSEGGVTLISVIGEENMSRQTLLREAHKIARVYADDYTKLDIVNTENIAPEGDFWKITSHLQTGYNVPSVTYSTFLPAWVAENDHTLNGNIFGVSIAANKLAESVDADLVEIKQVAKAKFDTNGFEAAALTTVMVSATNMPQRVTKKVVNVNLNFNKPYAVIAVATHNKMYSSDNDWREEQAVWRGIPLFSAFVCEGTEPEPKKLAE